MIAEELDIKLLSLYNHISSLDEVKMRLMIYGWKQIEEKILDSAVGVAGYEALKNMCYAFYEYSTNNKGVFTAMLWYNKYENMKKEHICCAMGDKKHQPGVDSKKEWIYLLFMGCR